MIYSSITVLLIEPHPDLPKFLLAAQFLMHGIYLGSRSVSPGRSGVTFSNSPSISGAIIAGF